MIIGSDIIFFSEAAKLLSQSMAHLLSEDDADARAIIANDVIRYANYEQGFEQSLIDNGLEVEKRISLKDAVTTHKLLIIKRASK